MKKLFDALETKMASIGPEDIEAHYWWNEFKKFCEEIWPPGKPFEYENKLEWVPEIEGFVVYILSCKNGSRFRGFSGHFKNRMLAHFNGMGGYTTKRMKPEYILHYEVFQTKQESIAREKFFSSWQGERWLKENEHLFNSIKP
jgi:predicted GIY-YIG superfamily endonuclease